MSTKLVLIEGIPGSGKTTTAEFVQDWFVNRGRETHLYLEGNLDHPADYESVLAEFPAFQPLLDQHAKVKGKERFLGYRKLQQELGSQLPDSLISRLARHEIYELPAEKYQRLLTQRWQEFALQAAKETGIYIFECCFLQNPLTMLLGRNNEAISAVQAYILGLAEIIRPLDTRLIYLEGMVRFYEMRQGIEIDLLPRLPWRQTLVPHVDWTFDRRQIIEFLEADEIGNEVDRLPA